MGVLCNFHQRTSRYLLDVVKPLLSLGYAVVLLIVAEVFRAVVIAPSILVVLGVLSSLGILCSLRHETPRLK